MVRSLSLDYSVLFLMISIRLLSQAIYDLRVRISHKFYQIFYCIPSQGRMMNHNKDEEISMRLLYKNITLSSLFLERVETSVVCEIDRDRQMKTHRTLEGLRLLNTAILILVFSVTLCYIHIRGST